MSKPSFRGVHRSAEELVTTLSKPHALQFFGPENLTPATAKVLQQAFEEVPEICRRPLASQASRMHSRVCAFLQALGRPKGESGMAITGVDLAALSPKAEYRCGEAFALTGADLQQLAAAAEVSYDSGRLAPADLFARLDAENLTELEQHTAQLMAITGPVYVMFDGQLKSQAKAPTPIIAVSIPGINFAYSRCDVEAFTRAARPADEPPAKRRRVVDEDAARRRMKEILHHVFLAFERHGVQYPCLNAIGCGAFKGPYDSVPGLWAAAASDLLRTHAYGFAAVLYSLPDFGDDNYSAFQREFARPRDMPLKTCVVLVEDRGMVCLADFFAQHKHKAGILNPSDAQAVRQGYVGMYWDGGHIALEEILAMQTTLLLQHKGINPQLYRDRTRWIPVDLDPDAAPKLKRRTSSSASASSSKSKA
eukprot:EG_transcript_11127